MTKSAWHKSSHSTNTNCVEVLPGLAGYAFRDSKAPGHRLEIARHGARCLLSFVKAF